MVVLINKIIPLLSMNCNKPVFANKFYIQSGLASKHEWRIIMACSMGSMRRHLCGRISSELKSNNLNYKRLRQYDGAFYAFQMQVAR